MRAKEINLKPLVGSQCSHVSLGYFSIWLSFARDESSVGSIRIECPYELRAASGELLESKDASVNEKENTRLGALLMAKVVSFEFSIPVGLSEVSDRFVLRFENGLSLAVIEGDDLESAVIDYENAEPKTQVI